MKMQYSELLMAFILAMLLLAGGIYYPRKWVMDCKRKEDIRKIEYEASRQKEYDDAYMVMLKRLSKVERDK